MHDLDVPRIGYVHTWTSTQDEGWVRLAFDNFKVPYTYFAAPKLREGNLKSKYDVIVFPHAGQGGTALITGGVQGNEPRPYKKTRDDAERRHRSTRPTTCAAASASKG